MTTEARAPIQLSDRARLMRLRQALYRAQAAMVRAVRFGDMAAPIERDLLRIAAAEAGQAVWRSKR